MNISSRTDNGVYLESAGPSSSVSQECDEWESRNEECDHHSWEEINVQEQCNATMACKVRFHCYLWTDLLTLNFFRELKSVSRLVAARVRALKDHDYSKYLELVRNSKDDRLKELMQKTDDIMIQLSVTVSFTFLFDLSLILLYFSGARAETIVQCKCS